MKRASSVLTALCSLVVWRFHLERCGTAGHDTHQCSRRPRSPSRSPVSGRASETAHPGTSVRIQLRRFPTAGPPDPTRRQGRGIRLRRRALDADGQGQWIGRRRPGPVRAERFGRDPAGRESRRHQTVAGSSRAGVKVVIAADAVPVGRYTRQMLDKPRPSRASGRSTANKCWRTLRATRRM